MRCAKGERYEQCTALIEAPCAKKSPRTRAVGGYLKHKTIDLDDRYLSDEKTGTKATNARVEKVGPERRFVRTQLRAISDSSKPTVVNRPRRVPVATDLPVFTAMHHDICHGS